jgi:hypothetical protein
MKSARSWIAACTMAALAAASHAVEVPISGTLSEDDPTYTRVLVGDPPTLLSGVGTAVSYDVFPFYVTLSGTYFAETLSADLTISPDAFTADDTFITLYQNAFNPAAGLSNALIANDDSGLGSLSLATKALTAGTQYYLVVTSYANEQFGPYTGRLNSTTGVGQVILGSVPELPTWAMLAAPLAVGAAWRRRRKVA